MDPIQAKQQMTLAEFRSLRDFIYAKSGIFFSESKQYFLENRLSKRIGELKLRTYGDYLSLLQGSQGAAELKRLFVEITTNETSFWRNPPQIEAFQNIVLPDAAKQARERGQSRLRIWSAACSSGEEPYTLAMICQDLTRASCTSAIAPRTRCCAASRWRSWGRTSARRCWPRPRMASTTATPCAT